MEPGGVGCGVWGHWMGSTYDDGEVGLTGVVGPFRKADLGSRSIFVASPRLVMDV